MGRGSGRGSSGIGLGGRVADDGKRFNEVRVRWELYFWGEAKKYLEKGEGSGEGRVNNWTMLRGGG